MKKPNVLKVTCILFGALLMLGLLSTPIQSGLRAFENLYHACKSQCSGSLPMGQPHRAAFSR